MAGTSLTLRDARPDDYADIARLTVEAYREFSDVLKPEDWMTMQANLSKVEERAKEATFIVAEQDGQVVGAVAYSSTRTRKDDRFRPDSATIQVLAVPPSHRRRGIGKLLSRECIRRARQDGAPRVGLYTSEVMADARMLYESLGFTPERDFELYGLRYWVYVLKLGGCTR